MQFSHLAKTGALWIEDLEESELKYLTPEGWKELERLNNDYEAERIVKEIETMHGLTDVSDRIERLLSCNGKGSGKISEAEMDRLRELARKSRIVIAVDRWKKMVHYGENGPDAFELLNPEVFAAYMNRSKKEKYAVPLRSEVDELFVFMKENRLNLSDLCDAIKRELNDDITVTDLLGMKTDCIDDGSEMRAEPEAEKIVAPREACGLERAVELLRKIMKSNENRCHYLFVQGDILELTSVMREYGIPYEVLCDAYRMAYHEGIEVTEDSLIKASIIAEGIGTVFHNARVSVLDFYQRRHWEKLRKEKMQNGGQDATRKQEHQEEGAKPLFFTGRWSGTEEAAVDAPLSLADMFGRGMDQNKKE